MADMQESQTQSTSEHKRPFSEWLEKSMEDNKTSNSILISKEKKAAIISVLQDPESKHKNRYKSRTRYGIMQMGTGEPQLYLLQDEPKF